MLPAISVNAVTTSASLRGKYDRPPPIFASLRSTSGLALAPRRPSSVAVV
jgi:hypothetical protein